MKKIILSALAAFFVSIAGFAQEIDSTQIWADLVESNLKYETGVIDLKDGNAKLTVPKGFKFLNKEQSIYVLTELWGNPVDSSTLGMLVPENRGVVGEKSWAFTISYDAMGYVKDDDADDIDYSELLKEQQKEFEEANPERVKAGYQPIQFVGWASTPFYDKNKKVLHWAKELKFGTDSLSTLNYNLRVLGRKGIFMLNAVASMDELNEVKSAIDKVITSVEFNEGSRYADFDSNIDEVAAWTIGGLVAGKILAKVGIFAVLAKFGKVIIFGLIAAGGFIWRLITGKRKKNDDDNNDTSSNIEDAKVIE